MDGQNVYFSKRSTPEDFKSNLKEVISDNETICEIGNEYLEDTERNK